jgi:Transglutaminase-like superfamily
VTTALRIICWCSAFAIGLATTVLALSVHDARDLVKIRNAMIYEVKPEDVFDWMPSSVPTSYLKENRSAPAELAKAVQSIVNSKGGALDDFDTALALARYMVANQRRPAVPIQSSTVAAHEAIVRDGNGYCADYTQVFNGLAHAGGLAVREWGMSFDNYGGDGHAFNEIYDRVRGKWIFLDTFNSFYVVNSDDIPLSVDEFRAALLKMRPAVRIRRIVQQKFGFKSDEMALHYYRRGADTMFMIWGANVFTYDESPPVRLAAKLSRSAEQAVAILTGIQPRIMIEEGTENRAGLSELRRYRLLVLSAGLAIVLFAISAFALLILGRRSHWKQP